jgi:hypothetical protein
MILCAIDILQSRWQHGEKVGYCYPSGLEKTLFKWELYVPLVTKGLSNQSFESSLWCVTAVYPSPMNLIPEDLLGFHKKLVTCMSIRYFDTDDRSRFSLRNLRV